MSKTLTRIGKPFVSLLSLFLVITPPLEAFSLVSEKVDGYIRAEMEFNSIPGLSFTVVRDGAVSLVEAYGVRNTATAEPMRTDMPVHLASVSKSLTALAIRRLEQQEKLDRAVPITFYLPQLGAGHSDWKRVTVGHLLQHRSGLRRRSDFLVPCCGQKGEFDLSLVAERLEGAGLESAPGAVFSYSNSNYVLLAALVERVSGRPFPIYMREEIFQPLGMNRTTSVAEDAGSWGLAEPHEWQWGRVRPSPSRFFGWYGASFVQSTAEDMGRLLAALLRSANPVAGEVTTPWWERLENGYDDGWYVQKDAWWLDGHLALEHAGNIWGGNTAAVLAPRLGAGAVVLTNVGTDRANRIARGLLRDAIGLPLPKPRPMQRSEIPDTWALVFACSAVALLLGSSLYGVRVRRQLQSGQRTYRPTRMGLLRAAILSALILLLIHSLFVGMELPLAALPSTVKIALPLLALSAAVTLLTAAASGLTPRRDRRTPSAQ